mmetsp:Transcript_38586/g.86119  ORF Transcript_38586/g.86119 Transcript_38586/m.86119 type:complete len:342 (+) Transcript_38586:782-1807(+)
MCYSALPDLSLRPCLRLNVRLLRSPQAHLGAELGRNLTTQKLYTAALWRDRRGRRLVYSRQFRGRRMVPRERGRREQQFGPVLGLHLQSAHGGHHVASPLCPRRLCPPCTVQRDLRLPVRCGDCGRVLARGLAPSLGGHRGLRSRGPRGLRTHGRLRRGAQPGAHTAALRAPLFATHWASFRGARTAPDVSPDFSPDISPHHLPDFQTGVRPNRKPLDPADRAADDRPHIATSSRPELPPHRRAERGADYAADQTTERAAHGTALLCAHRSTEPCAHIAPFPAALPCAHPATLARPDPSSDDLHRSPSSLCGPRVDSGPSRPGVTFSQHDHWPRRGAHFSP